MKIRDKLFLGFGLYIFLSAVLGFFAYRGLHAITTRLTFLEVADDVIITLLEARRYEKNFLLYKDKGALPEFKNYMGKLKDQIDNIRSEIISEIGVENYDAMKGGIAEYEQWFEKTVRNHEQQNKQVELVRVAGRGVERGMSGRRLQVFLVLRRYEKNLIIYKDRPSYDTFVNTYASLGMEDDPGVARYRSLVAGLYELYGQEIFLVEKVRSTAREIEYITVKLSRNERADIASDLNTSMKFLLYALLTVVVAGTAINIKLAVNIATPVRRLERQTKRIAAGDFSGSIETSGNDEIASLGASFNQMEAKLKEALGSLEHTIHMLKEKQAQLVEREKLASIGLLVAGVAHEINNPLTSVLTFSNLMLEQAPKDDPNRETLRMMAWETNKARNIVRQLLSFAREAPIKPSRMDVNKTAADVVDSFVTQDVLKGIELRLDLDPGLPEINADPAQVEQVITNIFLNAVYSITPPGSVGVSTRQAGRFVEIAVSDTGCGIPAENIGRIFEPFFTTRVSGRGTGLGLAVSYGIIKKHLGDIEVKSEVGKGSTFYVRLPINGQVQGDSR